MNVAARGESSTSGIGVTAVAGTATMEANPPSPADTSTRWPGSIPETDSPTATTRPADSVPGTKGTGGLI